MVDVLSRLDLFNIGRRYVVTNAKNINPREIDVAGSDINLVIGASAFMASAVMRHAISRTSALLLDGCETDEELDRFAFDRYQLVRKGAAAAVGECTFERPSNVQGSGSIPVGTKITSLTGIEYIMLSPANFTTTDLVVSGVRVRAAQAGKAFQVGANQLRRFAQPSAIFDQTITVNNPDPMAGGEAVETKDVFKERIRAYWSAAQRGTLGAIEFGALKVPGVHSAQTIELQDSSGRASEFIELFIADSSGVASQALASLVDQELMEWRCGGIYVNINTSRPEIVDFIYRPTFIAGVDTVSLTERLRNAIVSFINSLGVNKPLLISDLGAVFSRFRREGLLPMQSSLIAPVGDLYPQQSRTLRTRKENVQILTPITTTTRI